MTDLPSSSALTLDLHIHRHYSLVLCEATVPFERNLSTLLDSSMCSSRQYDLGCVTEIGWLCT